ncbi:MAG: N-6 DNA methylase [Methanosarcinales archaeon]|nr:MAG: N-6 DNA methylase [Methanosarcinales archaeon]
MERDLDKEIYDRMELFVQRFHTISDTLKDEEDVKSSIIDEFLKILGWNLQDHLEVKKEQKVEGRIRADYALKVDGKPKIYIEAKALDKNLEGVEISKGGGKRTYIEQAINYAYNSGVNWALLTNGKRWMLFNAYWKGTHKDRIAFDFEIDDFLKDNNFNKIKLLAREHIIAGKLDEYFKGARAFRPPVDEQIVKFLLDCRSDLTNSILKNNKDKYSADKLREGIQIILDRFLFFKICEDRDILRFGRLKEMFEYFYKAARSNELFIRGLKLHYREFDDIYDGELFAKHPCEDLIIDKNVFEKIILGLYEYDFSTIDADILGRIYENYLGNTLQELEKGLGWVADNQERKKFGQYYTPQYVVDYIIDNVGITADSKILDPACGSGAFLIKAYDRLKRLNQERIKRIIQKNKHNLSKEDFKKWEKEELPKIEEESVKKILTENIHGVDFNPESVEITKINLWLRSIRKDTPLNKLENNIACGNSLISGTEDELKQYFGDDWKEKRPFDWEDVFPDVFENGGFDVVIGNPPYVRADVDDEKYQKQRKWMESSGQYETLYEKWDLFIAFIERGLKLLKEGGMFSFIVSNSFNTSKFADKLKRHILDNYYLVQIDFFKNVKVFQGVGVESVILTIKKSKKKGKTRRILHTNSFENIKELGPSDDIKKMFRISAEIDFDDKFEDTESLGNICYVSYGLRPNSDERCWKGEFKKDDLISKIPTEINKKPYVEAKYIERYKINEIRYLEWDTERSPKKLVRPTFPELYVPPKIIRGATVDGTYDESGVVCNHSINVMVKHDDLKSVSNRSIENSIKKWTIKTRKELEGISDNFDLKYILAILNSKFAKFYLNTIRRHRIEYYFYPDDFKKLPIKNIPKIKQQPLITLADKMLSLNKELQTINTNFFEYVDLHPKIKDTDLGFYFNQLSMNDRKTLNNANGIRGKIKKAKVREEGDWLFVSVDYVDENEELIENFDVLKCRFGNTNFQQFIKHCILNYRKSISTGNLLDRILKINNIPIFNNRDKTKNQQVIDEIMDPFLPALERKEKIEKEVEETDRTIDQMVYELYGLTDNEIKIVEEATA